MKNKSIKAIMSNSNISLNVTEVPLNYLHVIFSYKNTAGAFEGKRKGFISTLH